MKKRDSSVGEQPADEGPRFKADTQLTKSLETRLDMLKQRAKMGFEVRVMYLPGFEKCQNGKRLLEEVANDTILIYSEDPKEALELVYHGFAEWILNQHARPYRQMANKLITLFEEQQYDHKEKLVEGLIEMFRAIDQPRESKKL